MAQQFDNIACTVCSCVCDDLRITVEAGRVTRAEGACRLAEPWFIAQNAHQSPVAEIEGNPAPLEAALDRAATLLKTARSPLICGLSRGTKGRRAAVALADRLGAIIDTSISSDHATSTVAMQEAGETTCTLGEVKNRADLVVFWGVNPLESHPRHFERYLVNVNDRTDRFVVVVDRQPTVSSAMADLFLPVESGYDFEALWTLRGLIRGLLPTSDTRTGIPLNLLQNLAERMKHCKCGIVFFGFGLSREGHRSVEALFRLVADLNDYTRFYACNMGDSGDGAAADPVLTWQTGYPSSVNMGRGYPRYNPGEYTAGNMILRGEVDACLLIGNQHLSHLLPAAMQHLQRLPTVVLNSEDVDLPITATVRFTTAIYGVHRSDTAYRMDGVAIPLRSFLPTDYPDEAEVLDAIRRRLG